MNPAIAPRRSARLAAKKPVTVTPTKDEFVGKVKDMLSQAEYYSNNGFCHDTKAIHITKMFTYMLSVKDIYANHTKFTQAVKFKLNQIETTINDYDLTKNTRRALLKSIHNLRYHILAVEASK